MSERLKLKRGLSDISPLFTKEEPESDRPRLVIPPQRMALERPEVFFIWSADDETDAHFLNNFFASKIVSPDASALLMKLEAHNTPVTKAARPEPWNKSLHRIQLPVVRVQEAFNGSQWGEDGTGTPEPIFLEIGMSSLLNNPELVRLLDHVILFLKPRVESVTETYRQLKCLAALQMRADVTVLFDADDAAGLPARLYELFSDFVSKHLSLSMNYLGTLSLSRGAEGLRQDIRWESWKATRIARPESIEKRHFLAWVEKLSKEKVSR